MNTCESNLRTRRMSGMPFESFEGAFKSFRKISRKLTSLCAFFCWVLTAGVFLGLVSGCGTYKEDLESAKQQIEKLNVETKKLTDEAARLNQEKSRLTDELSALSDKNTRMQRELDDVNKTKAALSAENREIGKKNSAAEDEITSLKKENSRLSQEVERLNKNVAELTPQPKPAPTAPTVPNEAGLSNPKQGEDLSPCDAVLAFMKASEAVVKQQKGQERTKSLAHVKEQYAPKMKGAPNKAIKAAESWVAAGVKFWDTSSSDSTFQLLQHKNTVLEACGKSVNESVFK